ncbi:MAG: DUF6569 family protein [Planctomycetota bacterium]
MQVADADYKLSGPYTHENLAVFLLHAPDRPGGRPYLTLQEALEQKKAVVYETEDVRELAIENLSDEEIYIQSGDIVKGGKQDRVLAVDFIAPAKSGKLPISAFCVERGRWRGRGAESAAEFSSSTLQISSRGAKLATRAGSSQQQVWEQVAESQTKLSSALGAEVVDEASVTSLQLTLEHTKVQESIEAHVKALSGIADQKPDVIGYAFAINGRFNSADAYSSHALFKKLWPKLLSASATEAVSELQPDEKFEQPKTEDVLAAMQGAQQSGKTEQKEVQPRVRLLTQQAPQGAYFRTLDSGRAEALVHESWVSST